METPRLWLRPFLDADVDAYAALCADPEVMRYVGAGGPLDRGDAWRQMAMFVGHWSLRGFGMWAVEERASRAFVGRVGLHFPDGWPDREIAWALARPYWGRGIALEAARAALAYAFEQLEWSRAISLIHPANTRSIRLAERLGERLEGETEVRGHLVRVYAIARSDPMMSGVLASGLLRLEGRFALAGWQWLFLVEGIPAVLLGIVAFFYLTDATEQAGWLEPAERTWLVRSLRGEQDTTSARDREALRSTLAEPVVWQLGLLTFFQMAGAYAYGLWSPQMIKAMSNLSDTRVSLVTSVIAVFCVVGMVVNGAHSDRRGERFLHIAVPALLAACGWFLCLLGHASAFGVLALSLVAVAIASQYGPFWALPTALRPGAARAGGIAVIVALGSIGGFVGPNLVGVLRDRTGNHRLGYLILGLMAGGAGLLALRLRQRSMTRAELSQGHFRPAR